MLSAQGTLSLQGFTMNPLGENTYIVWCTQTLAGAIIDPGNYNESEDQILSEFIEKNSIKVKYLLNTHAHIDHIFGNHWVIETYNVPYALNFDDIFLLERSIQMAALWNLNYKNPSPLPTIDLKTLPKITIGNCELEIRQVPGHAPGHVVFVHHESKTVVAGDTLFSGSIGRTDLPGGNHQQLLDAIEAQLFSLPEDFTVFSGHGPATQIGIEKATNPFF